MIKRIFNVILFLGLGYPTVAAQLKGRVLIGNTIEPVMYANVGVIGKDVGTTTDELGNFKLDVSPAMMNDTLMVSMIGYEPYKITIAQCLNTKGFVTINLEESTQMLNEVVVKSSVYRHKRLGNLVKGKAVKVGFTEQIMGNELGTLMKIKRKPTFIDSVRFDIAHSTFDTVFFRLNIYEKKGETFSNILVAPIYISLPKAEVKESIVIDLSDKNLVVENDFIVTLEMVKNLGKGELQFCAKLGGNPTYIRSTSQGVWKKIAMAGISTSAFVTY